MNVHSSKIVKIFLLTRDDFRGVVSSNIDGLKSNLYNKLSPYFTFLEFDPAGKTISNFQISIKVIQVSPFKGGIRFEDGVEVEIIKSSNVKKKVIAHYYKVDELDFYYFPVSENIVTINRSLRKAIIIGHDDRFIVNELIYMIRDASYINLVINGYVQVHASAVVDKNDSNKTLLCIGRSNSGKTSTLLHLLYSGRYNLLSNGRVFVKPHKKGLRVLGTPENIGIRQNTYRKYTELRKMANELAVDKVELKISYRKVSEIFGIQIIPEANISELLITNFFGEGKITEGFIMETITEEVNSYSEIKRREWIAFDHVDERKYEENAHVIRGILKNMEKKSIVFLEDNNYIFKRL